jgi:hypothetical protein
VEENEKETETLDFEKPTFTFKPNGHHSYRQMGPYAICKSCEVQHAIWIGMEKIMVGENEKGEPILKNRKDYEKGTL